MTLLGESLRMQDKYTESIELFDQALKIDHRYVDALWGKGKFFHFHKFRSKSNNVRQILKVN